VGDEVKRRALRLAALLLLALPAARGAYAQRAVIEEVSASGDADHFGVFHLRTGVLSGYDSPLRYYGAAVQVTRYAQGGWHGDAPAVLLLWRNQKRETLAGTMAEAGVVRVEGRTRVIGDATWSLRPNARTGIELLGASGLVETRRALQSAITHHFAAVSAERQAGERFTAVGLAGYQRFSDGNERIHLRARLIWMLIPAQGLSAQLRWRRFESRGSVSGVDYFNPARYGEWQAGLVMRKRRASWILSGTVAAGRESIDGNASRPTALAELRAEGTIAARAHIIVNASYNRSAGFGLAERYWYRTIGLSLRLPL